MDDLQTTMGIVLHVTSYREYDKILTLFTPNHGLLKLFVKGSYKTHLSQHPYTTPFAKGEYLYRGGKSLPRLQEGTLLSSYLSLRNSLESLEGAFKLAQGILKSQSQGKSAPKLFSLFAAYLDKLPDAPQTLTTSFFLKILKHEGLLQIYASCHSCQELVEETWRLGGECFCKVHAPENAVPFSSEEEKSLLFLSEARSLNEICKFSFEKKFTEKIFTLFEGAMSQ